MRFEKQIELAHRRPVEFAARWAFYFVLSDHFIKLGFASPFDADLFTLRLEMVLY